eukprot:11155763-Lingulodinium_polyedra.AAC.1
MHLPLRARARAQNASVHLLSSAPTLVKQCACPGTRRNTARPNAARHARARQRTRCARRHPEWPNRAKQ